MPCYEPLAPPQRCGAERAALTNPTGQGDRLRPPGPRCRPQDLSGRDLRWIVKPEAGPLGPLSRICQHVTQLADTVGKLADNYPVDLRAAIIVDVEASRRRRR